MSKKLVSILLFVFSFSLNAEQITKLEFAEKLNKQIPLILENSNARGIAISTVHGNEMIGSFYYGDADTEKSKPITQKTLFSVGSISKVITAWGAMKLVEQGKVNLDKPVNNGLLLSIINEN